MEWVLQTRYFDDGEWFLSNLNGLPVEKIRLIIVEFPADNYRILWEDGTIEMGNEV